MDRIPDSSKRFERIFTCSRSRRTSNISKIIYKYFEIRDIPARRTSLKSQTKRLRYCLELGRDWRDWRRRFVRKKKKKKKKSREEGTKDLVLDSNSRNAEARRSQKGRLSRKRERGGEDKRASILSLFPARRSHVPARSSLCSAVTCSTLVHQGKQNNNRVHTLIGWPNPRVYARSRVGTGFNCDRICYRQRVEGIRRRNKWKKKN